MAGIEIDKAQLAAALSVNKRTIETFQLDQDFPAPRRHGRKNLYPLTECIAWFVEHRIAQRIGEADGGDSLDLAQERALLARAQRHRADVGREREALQLARERGELVAVADVADDVGAEYDRVRSRMLALPAKLAPIIAIEPGIDVCRELIEREVHAALLELSAPDDLGDVNGR